MDATTTTRILPRVASIVVFGRRYGFDCLWFCVRPRASISAAEDSGDVNVEIFAMLHLESNMVAVVALAFAGWLQGESDAENAALAGSAFDFDGAAVVAHN